MVLTNIQGELADAMEQASKQKGPSFTREELRALFSLNTSTSCETAVIMRNSASAQDWLVRRYVLIICCQGPRPCII